MRFFTSIQQEFLKVTSVGIVLLYEFLIFKKYLESATLFQSK
jgi:hypothetical protein